MATIRCGIRHKDTKYTDKCNKTKTKKQKQNEETKDKYFFKIL
jgi:hypothetical protein